MILEGKTQTINHQDTKGTKNCERQFFRGKTSTKNFFLPSLVPLVSWWLTLFLFPVFVQAQILTGAGDALPSMNLPDGAKAAALGGAFSAWADDTSAIYWNPAGMVWLPKIQVETAFNQWFQDSFFQDISLVWPEDWGAMGGRISYINLGTIDLRDGSGTLTGATVSPEDWGGTFAIAGKLGGLSAGLAVKAYTEILSTYYGYGGLGIDMGALYKLGPLGLAGGVRNIGIVTGYTYPTEGYTGLSLGFDSKALSLHLASDATFTDGGQIIHHGLEIGYQQTVFLRAGYQWLPSPLPSEDEAGLSGGVGIDLGDFRIDYAMTSYGNLGLTNQVALSYQFVIPASNPDQEDDEDARVSNNGEGGGARGDEDAQGGITMEEGPDNQIKPIQPTPAPTTAQPAASSDGLNMTLTRSNTTPKHAFGLGYMAFRKRNYNLAALYLKKVLSMTSSQRDSKLLAQSCSMLGMIYQYFVKAPDHLEMAKNFYKAALKYDPKDVSALYQLPQLESNDSGSEESRGDDENGNPAASQPPPPPGVSENEPGLTMRAAYHIGINAYKARDFKKSAQYLKEALTLPASSADSVFVGEANSMLGIIYQYYLKPAGNLELARRYYRAALQIDPSNSTAQKHLPQVEDDSTGGQ